MIRHSIAEANAPGGDYYRALTPEGRTRFQKTVEWLKKSGVHVEAVFHSPLVRTTQTADILSECYDLQEELGDRDPLQMLGSGFQTTALLYRLEHVKAETVAIIGHEPSMSRVTSELIGGGSLRFSPGSIAAIQFSGSLDVGTGRLLFLLDPHLFNV